MYFFEATLSVSATKRKEILVIYSGQFEGSSREYAGIFERRFSNFLKPDGILFIYPSYLNETLTEYFSKDNPFHQNITRFGLNVPIDIMSFNSSGDLTYEYCTPTKSFDNLSQIKHEIIEEGIFNLARMHLNEVILESPPGTIFSKPSGESSEEFIKASGLANNYSQQQFVAYSLLSNRPTNTVIKEIYIDTAGIASFAEAVCYYLYKFSDEPCKTIRYESFSSYGGMNNCKIDNPENVWVIISASHSNSLYAAIINKWNLAPNQAITVLTFKDTGKRLVNISKLSKHIHAQEKNNSAVKVHIVGENFTAEVSEPKKVVIKKSAKPSGLKKAVKDFYKSKVFKCNKVVQNTNKPKPIYIDFNKSVASHEGFKDWLETIIRWHLPYEWKWVVVGNDPASELLFQAFESKLKTIGVKIKYRRIDFRSAGNKVTGRESVIVLTPVISSGRTLLDLNREMRLSEHNGNRLFISPFVLSSTKGEFEKLKNSLLLGPETFRYQFFSFFELRTGNNDQESSWELEKKVLISLNASSRLWRNRLDRLDKQGDGLEGYLGCPSSQTKPKLGFSRDFAFWSGWSTNHEDADHEAIYITVSAVLQHLRERPCANDDPDSLRSHIYQNAVIDPDNFVRFNDSILQSCLWRAANSTELDYRRSDELSYAMNRIILRVIDDLNSHKSESGIDLLMGVATGKIRLSKNALKELVSTAKEKLTGRDGVDLLNYIKGNYIDKPTIK